MKSRFKIILIVVGVLLLLVLAFFIYRFTIRKDIEKNINYKVTIEYGNVVKREQILKYNYSDVSIEPSLDSLKEVGSYKVNLEINNEEFTTLVEIKDTTPPLLEVKDLVRYIDEEMPNALDFVESVSDLSSYELEPVIIEKMPGEQVIKIKAIDKYGNYTEKEAKITILEDKDAPKIEGLNNIIIETGDRPDYKKGVKAVDARFGEVAFTFDDSKVNYNAPGTYTVYYTASDSLGNSVTLGRKVIIKQKNITYMIQNFPTFNQFPNFPNGCESVALYTLLKYYGVQVTPQMIVDKLPKGDYPYLKNGVLYGGNPEVEFVGDPNGKGYGVYQKPIMNVANQFKGGMIDYTGHSLNEVLNLVQKKIPVQVWASINLENTSVCTSWIYKETGEKINWICDLHSMVIVGYNLYTVYVSDPYTGKIEAYNRNMFEKMYNLFGKRALYYEN